VDWTWTCDATSGICTLSADLQTYLTDLLQGVWFLAGAVVVTGAVLGFVNVFLSRRDA